jgi:hypothetical protein
VSLSIEILNSLDLRTRFVDFYDTVYEYRDARWPGKKAEEHLLLSGESPLIAGKSFRALLAIDGGKVVARGIALMDSNYLRYWNDHVGHLILFEALDESDVAVRQLVDEACAYLSQHGIESVRAGYGLLDTPFPIDDYESLPPMSVRQSPKYYHRLLKNAGFQTEKGWVDYRLRITDESLELGRMLRDRLLPVSYELIQFADLAETKLVSDLTEIRNECFKSHWGTTPVTEDEVKYFLKAYEPTGLLTTSVLAYRDSKVVGMVIATPEMTALAIVRPPRVLSDTEKLNSLLLGVRESERGTGLRAKMAASVCLDLATRGAKYVDGTLVQDDNWPSRGGAEYTGFSVWANYITYRRNFRGQAEG